MVTTNEAPLCVVHRAEVWGRSDTAMAWLDGFCAAWREQGEVVAATAEHEMPAWADESFIIDESMVIGPAPLAAGARLHGSLRGRRAAVLVVSDVAGAAWGVLEARRAGLDHGETVVVAVVNGPHQRDRSERLERALGFHDALRERLDDHLLAWADVIVGEASVLEWCAGRVGEQAVMVPLAEPSEAIAAVQRQAAVRRAVTNAGHDPALVTAVVTHYNRPDMVRRAIASLLAQTYPALEILVVDDGSIHPQAAPLLDELEQRDFERPVRVIRKENGGLGSARNEGLRQANGELVVFLDDDDEAEPTYVERMATALQCSGASAAVVGFRVMHDAETGPLDGMTENLQWMYFSPAADLAVLDNIIGGAAAMFRRSDALAAGGFHEIKHLTYEDWALLVKVALAGGDIVAVPEALLRYRVSPSSMLRTFPLWGSRDQVFDAYRSVLPASLSAWPEVVYGLHARTGQLEGQLDELHAELSQRSQRCADLEAQLAALRTVAEHRDALLASRSWKIGSNITRAVGRGRGLVRGSRP